MDTSQASQSKASVTNLELDASNTSSFFSEDAVQELLWDLYDGKGLEGDQEVDVGTIQDNVQIGFKPIYDAVTNGVRTTRAFTTLYAFMSTILGQISDPAVKADIVALARAENIDLEHSNEFEQFTNATIKDGLQIGTGTPNYVAFDVKVGRLYTDVPVDGGAVTLFGAGTPFAGDRLETSTRNDPQQVGNKLDDFVYFKFAITAPGDYEVKVTPDPVDFGGTPRLMTIHVNKRRLAVMCDATSAPKCDQYAESTFPAQAAISDSPYTGSASAPEVYTVAVAAYTVDDAGGRAIAKSKFSIQITKVP